MESIADYKQQHGQHRSGKMFMTFKLSLTFAIMHKLLDCLIFKTTKPFTDAARLANVPKDLQPEECE